MVRIYAYDTHCDLPIAVVVSEQRPGEIERTQAVLTAIKFNFVHFQNVTDSLYYITGIEGQYDPFHACLKWGLPTDSLLGIIKAVQEDFDKELDTIWLSYQYQSLEENR